MRLTDYLRPDLILCDLDGPDAAGTVARFAAHVRDAGIVPDTAAVERGLLAREQECTTVMGHGVAIPHATLEGLPGLLLLLGIAPEPIPFGPPGTDPARLFFVLLSPPGAERDHIRALARICRLVRHSTLVDDLLEAGDPGNALEALARAELKHA